MKRLSIKDRMILSAAKNAIRVFVFSTKFGKQTYTKRAIQNVWKAQTPVIKLHKVYPTKKR